MQLEIFAVMYTSRQLPKRKLNNFCHTWVVLCQLSCQDKSIGQVLSSCNIPGDAEHMKVNILGKYKKKLRDKKRRTWEVIAVMYTTYAYAKL